MRNIQAGKFSLLAATLFLLSSADVAVGVDLEAFEFNDPDFTELSNATNSVNGGNNWSDNIVTSVVVGGEFFIGKDNLDFSTSHLQIDDINSATSGSRYIVAEFSGWNFVGNVVGEGEELRLAFLDDNTGSDGSTVTAEVRIDRNTTSEAIELRGVAVGVGSSSISNRATLNTTQSNAFTMVLELNKTSNTYEIFYKDGSSPSQSLGTGSVAPTRDGNSMRLVVNNNFGDDFSEFLSIDRIALTDGNPLTDLLTLEINRDTGLTKLINTSGATVSGVQSTSLTSDIGAIDGSAITSFSGTLTAGQEVTLSTGSGPWIKNPTEDLRFELDLGGGNLRSANVNFVGNDGERFALGDLNFDGDLTVADWTIFIAGAETDLSGLSIAEAYQSGDLDGDGANSIEDFGLFETAFDTVNGVGAFATMLASVPEPSSLLLVAMGIAFLTGRPQKTYRR